MEIYNKKFLVVDGNSIMNRAFYGIRQLSNSKGVPTNAIVGFLNIIQKLIKEYSPTHIAVAFDVSRKTFRNEIFTEYKANRKGMPDELREQMDIIKQIIPLMSYTSVGVEGYEGDDIIGTLSNYCTMQHIECIVATGDRDCLQLVNSYVKVSLAKTKGDILYNENDVFNEFSITPKQIVDLKALMGDSSDNIPGVKGIGEKTATNIIEKCSSIEYLYDNIDNMELSPRIKSLLISDKAIAFTSKKLATINCNVPISLELDNYSVKPPQCADLLKILQRLELNKVIANLGLSDNVITDDICKGRQLDTYEVIIDATVLPVFDDKIDFLIIDNALVVHFDDKIYLFNNIPIEILVNELPKRTFKAKELYKLANGRAVGNVFDIELAAYLLSPDTKVYDLSTLLLDYLSIEVDNIQAVAYISEIVEILTTQLKEQGMYKLFLEIEMPLCEVLADMEKEGFLIDKIGLEKYSVELLEEIDTVTKDIYNEAGFIFNINSTKELAMVLFEKLGLKGGKKTKTGYSTSIEVLESLYDTHPIIPLIMSYRKLAKLHSTYVIGLLNVIGDDCRVHSTFNQTETKTGRISSSEPNVQNIPIRTTQGAKIRDFFIAKDGYCLIDADYSQIELRVLADIADDKTMQTAFVNGDDIHTITAAEVFCGGNADIVTKTQRSRAKAINFGIVYGIGAFSLSKDINVSVYEAKEYIAAYLQTYSGVRAYMDNVIEQAQIDGYVTTIFGRKRILNDINAKNKQAQAFAKRIALNTPIQGTAADIIKIAMIKVFHRMKQEQLDAKLILQVHDELIIEAPILQSELIKAILKEEMERATTLKCPMIADVSVGDSWLKAK